MKRNSKDEDDLQKIITNKRTKKSLPSLMVRPREHRMMRSIKLFLAKVTTNIPYPSLRFFPGGDSIFNMEGEVTDAGIETEEQL